MSNSFSPSRREAARALNDLAGIMYMQGKADHASRIHRRAEVVDPTHSQMASISRKNGDATGESDAVAAMSTLAHVHAARQNYEEAIRIQKRMVEVEEERAGRDSVNLMRILLPLADYLDAKGEAQEAQCVRRRVSNLMELHQV